MIFKLDKTSKILSKKYFLSGDIPLVNVYTAFILTPIFMINDRMITHILGRPMKYQPNLYFANPSTDYQNVAR